MLAIEYQGDGGVEVLAEGDRPEPISAPGEVLIKVAGFGLNRADIQQRIGVYPPPPGASDIPGLEVAGIVEAVGQSADKSLIGQRVCALLAGGGYAQYAAVPAGHILQIPAHLDLVDAAGFMEVAATVVSNLFLEAKVVAGQNVLIHGGSGGIGSMAIQLCAAAGANVIVTAPSPEKIAHCLALGAQHGINYREEDFVARTKGPTSGQGVDAILDVVGAKYLDSNIKALALDGTLTTIGLIGGARAELNIGLLMGKPARVIGRTLRARPAEQKSAIVAEVAARLLPLLEAETLDLAIDRRFSFTDIHLAHEYFDSVNPAGKIVVTS